MSIPKLRLLTLFSCLYIGLFCFFTFKSIDNQEDPNLVYNDRVYAKNIKTVKLYSRNQRQSMILDYPITSLNQNNPLTLEFDELNEDARYYQAKISYCNWDWTPSDLHSIEYLNSYNEIDYQSYSYSINTKIPYTHYIFSLPAVKLPGNYLVYVYDKDDPDNIILSRRFIVYNNEVKIDPEPTYSNGIKERTTHQQINFSISYQGLDLLNPMQDLKVVIRQNFSWFRCIKGLQPTQINQQQQMLVYRQFNLENNFPGGNEYRYFDMKSNVSSGRNVDRITTTPERIDAFLAVDKARAGQAYGIWQDMDGAYYISTLDNTDIHTEANYINTHFFLQTGTKLNTDVYLFGEVTFRQLLPEYKLNYDSDLGGYTGNFLLKEGYYEYLYVTPDDEYQIEGNHYETENTYDIIVYYRPPSKIYDEIVGYIQFKSNNN